MFDKAKIIIKRFWYIPIILILVVILSIFMRRGNPALDILNNAIDGYKRQIAEMERLNKEKEKQKAELEARYQLIIRQLESQYQSDNVKLDEERKKRVKELLEKYKDNEEMLAKAFSSQFGLKLEK